VALAVGAEADDEANDEANDGDDKEGEEGSCSSWLRLRKRSSGGWKLKGRI
jgi:hypothetical protein